MSFDSTNVNCPQTSIFSDLIAQGILQIGDGYRARNDELGGAGAIFLRAGHVRDTHIDFDGADKFQTKDNSKFKEKLSRSGDVVVTTKGNSTGRVAFVTGDMPEFVYSPHLSYWRSLDETRLCQGFLRAWSRGVEFKNQLDAMSRSTDMAPYLSLSDQKRLRITLLPVVEQREVATLLDALDDRITLLRETNATLEAIAQALFKSWFVNFDPVRAKQEERAPEGLDETTAAMFPDGFEESELGLVPRGWRVLPLGEVVDTVGGATPDTKEPDFWDPAEFCWTTPKDLSGAQAPVLLTTERKVSAKGLEKISSGLLPTGTLLMSSRAPIGYLAIAQTPLAINQGYIAMPPGSTLPPPYMLFWCRQNMEGIKARANGSTFMEISKKAFRPIPILVPPGSVIQAFTDVTAAIFDRLVENEKQAETLADLRDVLLPRLISGELRLPEAEALAA